MTIYAQCKWKKYLFKCGLSYVWNKNFYFVHAENSSEKTRRRLCWVAAITMRSRLWLFCCILAFTLAERSRILDVLAPEYFGAEADPALKICYKIIPFLPAWCPRHSLSRRWCLQLFKCFCVLVYPKKIKISKNFYLNVYYF